MTEGTLEARLERLERQNRRLRLGMLAVVAALGALVCVAATNPAAKVLQAEKFEVVDAQGTVRAALSVLHGSAALVLCDDKGNGRALLSVLADGSLGLSLVDEKGEMRALLGLDAGGSPGLGLLDENGKAIWSAPTGVAGTGETREHTSDTGEWVEVGSWTGKGTRNTETFTVRSPWKILWDTRGNYLSILVYSPDGRLVDLAANVHGADRDESVQHKGGTFYLDITAIGQYEVKVLERR